MRVAFLNAEDYGTRKLKPKVAPQKILGAIFEMFKFLTGARLNDRQSVADLRA